MEVRRKGREMRIARAPAATVCHREPAATIP